MKIRKATTHDARRISYLICRSMTVNPNRYTKNQQRVMKKRYTPANIKKFQKTRMFFCGIQHNKLLGVVGIEGTEITTLFVSPSETKKGVGSKLLTFIINHIKKKKKHKKVWLFATPSGRDFYKKFGFKKVKVEVLKIDGERFRETIMEKKI